MGGEPENNNSSIVVLPFFFTNYFNFIIILEIFNLLNLCFVLDATVFCAQ